MSEIVELRAMEILDSRARPTLRVEARLGCGASGAACVPSGASTGSREALELRDGDASRYHGQGVLGAMHNVNGELRQLLQGHPAADQEAVDRSMCEADGTPNKARLGANAILGVSLAVAHAAAAAARLPLYAHIAALCGNEELVLPLPMLNILNGGVHAANSIDIQEFMVQPRGASSYSEALRWGVEIFHALKSFLKQRGLGTAVGDEGGFAPELPSSRAVLDALVQAVEDAGLRPGAEVGLALDCAATEFYAQGAYRLQGEQQSFTAAEFSGWLEGLCEQYPVHSIEDGMAEDDWEGWKTLSRRLGERVQLVGDDLFVTDSETLRRGVREGAANAVLIKLNQVGTLSETLECIRCAREAGYAAVVSHRSGETEDVSIADLAVGAGTGQIKTGAPCRSERTAKYNRLLCIEQELGTRGHWAGAAP